MILTERIAQSKEGMELLAQSLSLLLLARGLPETLLSQVVRVGDLLAHPARLRRNHHPEHGYHGKEDVLDTKAKAHSILSHAFAEFLVVGTVRPMNSEDDRKNEPRRRVSAWSSPPLPATMYLSDCLTV